MRKAAQARCPTWLLYAVSATTLLALGLAWFDVGSAKVAELLVFASFWLWFSRAGVLRCFVGEMPRPHRRVMAGFLVAMIVGHLFSESRDTFPFAAWHMYSRAVEHDTSLAAAYRFAGVRPDGTSVPIELVRVYGRSASKVSHAAQNPIARSRRTDVDEPERWRAQYRAVVRGILNSYNRRNPDAPIRAIDIYELRVPLAPASGESEGSRHFLERVALERAS